MFIGCKCPAGCLVGMLILPLGIFSVFLHTLLLLCVCYLVVRAFLARNGQEWKVLICYFIFIPSDSWTYTENQPC